MLDQVALADAVLAGVLDQRGHGLPLVVPREQQRLRPLGLAGDRVGLRLDVKMHEGEQDPQPAVALPHALPEVRRRRTVRVGGVACATAVAGVERQEGGGRTLEVGGHLGVGVGDREVHQGAVSELEQGLDLVGRGVAGRAVTHVLLDGQPAGLGEVGLQLDGGHGQAVDEEHQVECLGVVLGVAHLAHHAHPVGRVPSTGLRVEVGLGARLDHREARCAGPEPAPQEVQRPARGLQGTVEHLHDPVEQLFAAGDLGELLGLGLLEPRDDVVGVERSRLVVAVTVTGVVEPSVGSEVLAQLGLELRLVVVSHRDAMMPHGARTWAGSGDGLVGQVYLHP